MADIIIENFEVEERGGDSEEVAVLNRSYPVSFLAAGTYKVWHHLGIVAGGGFEYAK